jgi:hypothetical protein
VASQEDGELTEGVIEGQEGIDDQGERGGDSEELIFVGFESEVAQGAPDDEADSGVVHGADMSERDVPIEGDARESGLAQGQGSEGVAAFVDDGVEEPPDVFGEDGAVDDGDEDEAQSRVEKAGPVKTFGPRLGEQFLVGVFGLVLGHEVSPELINVYYVNIIVQ